jgi:hypothetical protein
MKPWILALALALPGPALACEHLSEHYELCSEGTPWETGDWVNGGDSATLTVGGIEYEGFEDYGSHDPAKTIYAEMDDLVRGRTEIGEVVPLMADRLLAADMAFARVIHKGTFGSFGTHIWVFMIAEDIRDPQKAGARILLLMRAPADTPLPDLDRLSREFAALVYPRKDIEGQ